MVSEKNNFLTGPLLTYDPVALAYLMDDTLFDIEEPVPVAKPVSVIEQVPTAEPVPAAGPVPGTEPVSVENPAKSPDLTYFGGNRSGLLFISDNPSLPGEHRLPEADMEAFEKILKALQLSLDDIALVNIAATQDALDMEMTGKILLDFFQPHKLVLLGTQIRLTAWEEENETRDGLHKVRKLHNIPVLHSFSFREMGADTDRKRQFWTNLKELLG